MVITTYNQAVRYVESFIGKIVFNVKSSEDPLERMRVFLNLLDNPQNKFKSILVGGTSGKGSTSYLISHILTTAGYKTGLTISPHLQKVNERLQINGKEISDGSFTELTNSMIRIIESMKKMKIGEPSYFEILIGMAFKYFADQKVDIAVVEVGMGGEFDATNTLNPLIAVLTNVGLDHMQILGNTVEKIAKTKAGIIKYGRLPHVSDDAQLFKSKNQTFDSVSLSKSRLQSSPKPTFSSSESGQALVVITGVTQPSVIKIVEDRCKKVGAKIYRLGKDFKISILNGFKLSLLGDYQKENASLAVETVRRLENFGYSIKDESIKKALSAAFFPGRFEVIKCHPEFISGSSPAGDTLRKNEMLKQVQHDRGVTLVLDGAHNPTKMHAFLASLQKLFPQEEKVFIVGFKFDKEIDKMLKQIVGVADEIIVTEFRAKTDVAVHASADALMIKDKLLRMKYMGKVTVEKDSKKALDKALAIQQFNNKTIIITGSLYLVGEIRSKISH
ncbi:MAG: folylpolyglutamate synthase/dihydrofolate synthase family protein [Candidatus Levybacteria bacterium]|nr:folylpolyglutamate synthase/dihydrofolate synthase family protein [Candidatus Levybacteria bacterium]